MSCLNYYVFIEDAGEGKFRKIRSMFWKKRIMQRSKESENGTAMAWGKAVFHGQFFLPSTRTVNSSNAREMRTGYVPCLSSDFSALGKVVSSART